MTTPAAPRDTGDFVTPGFVQSLDVWGRYVRAGGGPLRGARAAAWWLFELYGTGSPGRPPSVAEQDALDVVLSMPAGTRSVTKEQNAALSTVRAYLADACPGVDVSGSRPDHSPFTLKEAADDLVARAATGDLPTLPDDAVGAAGHAWDHYSVPQTGPMSDSYWDDAPGGTDTREVEMELEPILGG